MDCSNQMKDEFALNWEALVSSTVDSARHAEAAPLPASEIFPVVETKLQIKRVSFEEFSAYHPAD